MMWPSKELDINVSVGLFYSFKRACVYKGGRVTDVGGRKNKYETAASNFISKSLKEKFLLVEKTVDSLLEKLLSL